MRLTLTGGLPPHGEVTVSGAKNAATRLMAAALLTDEGVVLENFPTSLLDARHKARFMEQLGATLHFDDQENRVEIEARQLTAGGQLDFVVPIRTTYLLAAGPLARTGIARVPYPGGCKLGDRKFDLHLKVWESFGCRVRELDDHIELVCPHLKATEIEFPISTVGGTENALLCAALAEGTTVIRNAYVTPEVRNLISLLRGMGSGITRNAAGDLEVHGRSRLHAATIRVISDRIEALTWIVYAGVIGDGVLIHEVPLSDMRIPLIHLREAGLNFLEGADSVYVEPRRRRRLSLRGFEVSCGTHPGVISDMQPFMVLLAMCANGRSLVVDYRYPERTAYLAQLRRFAPGALEWEPGRIRITGPVRLKAAEVESTDLRGSMALILAGLIAEGVSHVDRSEMALRGYNHLAEKLHALGISVELGMEPT